MNNERNRILRTMDVAAFRRATSAATSSRNCATPAASGLKSKATPDSSSNRGRRPGELPE